MGPDRPQRSGDVEAVAAHTGYRAVAYTASKWAVRAIAQSAADELGGLGIRVNVYRDVRMFTLGGGTTEALRNLIATSILRDVG